MVGRQVLFQKPAARYFYAPSPPSRAPSPIDTGNEPYKGIPIDIHFVSDMDIDI